MEVEHHFVGSGEQPRSAQLDYREAARRPVGEVGLGRTAEGAIGYADAPAAQGVVDHLMHFHDVLGVGTGLAVDDDSEDDAGVRVPGAAADAGNPGVIERGDAALGAGELDLLEGPVVDQDAPPTDQAPVDRRVLVREEGRPAGLDQFERLALPGHVTGRRRQIPGDQPVGHDRPGESPRHISARQRLEGQDHAIGAVPSLQKAQQVREQPGHARVSRRSDACERGEVDRRADVAEEPVEVGDKRLVERAARDRRRRRRLRTVSERKWGDALFRWVGRDVGGLGLGVGGRLRLVVVGVGLSRGRRAAAGPFRVAARCAAAPRAQAGDQDEQPHRDRGPRGWGHAHHRIRARRRPSDATSECRAALESYARVYQQTECRAALESHARVYQQTVMVRRRERRPLPGLACVPTERSRAQSNAHALLR